MGRIFITGDTHGENDIGKLQSDKLTQFLMSLEGRLEYKMWYFGHHHIDR